MSQPILKNIPIELLVRGRFQPRRQFDADALSELAQSIRSNGLVQPIVVRPLLPEKYEIIAGERRWRAAQLAGLTEVTCLINNYSDEQAAEVTTVENINRVDLNPIEEAEAYQRLMDEFGYVHEEIAAVVGKSRTKITNTLRLLKLEPFIREALISRQLSEGHGKVLVGLPEHIQRTLAEKSIANQFSVRQLEKESKKLLATKDSHTCTTDPNLKKLEHALAAHIGSPVNVEYDGQGKGRLMIDFHNLEILQGLFEKMKFKYSEDQ
ncbi:MAG: ParB/RepB/Spo0J family partition protein [Proteobacteria bacterium]|nr:ParB/RepB/Spo0J family partition protein [Pseudomonadota bacterium]